MGLEVKKHRHLIKPKSRLGRKLWLIIRGVPPRGKYTIARRLLQLIVLALFTIQLVTAGVIIKGSLASSKILDERVPGIKTIDMMDFFAWLEQAAATHSPTLESVIAVTLVFLLYMVLLGRFFCGWVCPMDLLFSLFERKVSNMRMSHLTRPHRQTKAEKIIPVAAMITYLVLSVILGQPFFTSYSPVAATPKLASILVGIAYNIPGATVGLAMSWATLVGIALIVNIVAEYVFGIKRFWCRFVCPIGNIYGFIANKYSPLRVKVLRPERCVGCNICSMACPMSIDLLEYIRQGRDVMDSRWFHCGRCVEVCPHHVLGLGFGLGSGRRRSSAPQSGGGQRQQPGRS
jgi:ferredoxin-type protein NapH